MANFERIASGSDCNDPEEEQRNEDSGCKRLKEKLNMKCRNDLLRETAAEFLGTFILVLMGNAVIAVVTLTKAGAVGTVVGPLGWALALTMAIGVTGGVSGCHVNPAVTLALATVGKFPWKKVLAYWIAQYVGAFVSSVVLYGVYYDQISHLDHGKRQLPPHADSTAHIFSTYAPNEINILTAFADQVVATMMLMMSIVGILDSNNMNVNKGSYPLLIGLSLGSVIFAFPSNCGAPLNPARDLAPRVFTAIAGWGNSVFSYRNYAYFWVPVVGPHVGAILGVWIYRLLVEQHWPVDSYDFGSPSEIKTNGEFKKKDDLPFVDKKRTRELEVRKVDE